MLPEVGVKANQVNIWPLGTILDDTPPATISAPIAQAGTAAKTLNVSHQTAKAASITPNDPQLSALVQVKPVRQPLTDFIAKLGNQSKIGFVVSPEVAAKNYSITVTVDGLKLEEAMKAVARLYDLRWTKSENGSYTLSQNLRSEFDTQLLRTGYFQWYRFREWNTGALKERDEAMAPLIERVFQEAGENVKSYPGVPFTNLLPTTQTQLREGVQRLMARNILQNQMELFPYLQGEWSFVLDSEGRALKFLVDGKPSQMYMSHPNPRIRRVRVAT